MDHRTAANACVPPEDMLCFDIYASNQALGRVYKPLLDPLGLTYPQYLVMTVLLDDAPISVGQIGRRLGLETSTLTPLLKRLEAHGFVTRRRSEKDERRVDVGLTDTGRDLSDRLRDVPVCVERATGLTEEGISDLRATLQGLRRSLEASMRE